MLNVIHGALQGLLHTSGHIDPLDAHVCFETPTEDWVASLTQPSIDFFLFDVTENTEKREGSPQLSINGSRAERRMPPRRIDLWYMVSVVTSDVADEHELLWRVLATLLRHEQFPGEVLPDPLRAMTPPMTGRVATASETRNLLDVWSAIGTKPRPAICYVLTASMDLALSIEAPLVLTRTARYHRMAADTAPRVGVHVGGVVRDASGRPVPAVRVTPRGSGLGAVTDASGRFALHSMPEGPLRLRVARAGGPVRELEVTVPAESYDIVFDG
jgi:hypothetical protein